MSSANLTEIIAREMLGRPDAHLARIEWLELERDGFAGTRVVLVDAPPCKTGPRKGQPNWRKATNEQVRLISDDDMKAATAAWSARTGLCIDCVGTGRRFVRWHINEGTTWGPCHRCDSTGKAAS